jgi:hypothetical protein
MEVEGVELAVELFLLRRALWSWMGSLILFLSLFLWDEFAAQKSGLWLKKEKKWSWAEPAWESWQVWDWISLTDVGKHSAIPLCTCDASTCGFAQREERLVAHTCNSYYLGGWQQEDLVGSRPTWQILPETLPPT